MTSPIERTPMQWNNHGALLMEIGRHGDAILFFKEALKALGIEEDRVVQRYSPRQSEVKDYTGIPTRSFNGWSRSGHESAAPSSDENGVFVFNRAICVRPIYHPSMFIMLASAAMFNLGLAEHLMALNGRSSSAIHYKRGRIFYEYSMNLLQQDSSSNFMMEKKALRTILFNNSGQIYFNAYMNNEAAAQCFAAVCGMILDSRERKEPVESIDEIDVAGLLSNAIFQLADTAPAA